MKDNKAMGYIPAIIIIIIVAFLVAGSVYFVRVKYNEARIETLKTNMLLIQWKAREYVNKKKANKEEIEYIGTKVSDMKEDVVISNVLSKNIISEEEYDKYYVLSDENLEALTSEISNEAGEYYIINYDTYEIIFTKGCTHVEGETLYKLSDIQRGKLEEKEEKSEEVEEEQEDKDEESDSEGE